MNYDNKKDNKREDLTEKIQVALDRAIQRVIIETKSTNGYMAVSDGNGGVKKIPAKDL
jgi:hypothetical protein